MPYKDPEKRRAYDRDRKRKARAAAKAKTKGRRKPKRKAKPRRKTAPAASEGPRELGKVVPIGTRGPAAAPAAVRDARGNRGNGAAVDGRQIHAPVPLEPPEWIDDPVAVDTWRGIAATQHALAESGRHWLTEQSVALLEAFVVAYSVWQTAVRGLANSQRALRKQARKHAEGQGYSPERVDEIVGVTSGLVFQDERGKLSVTAYVDLERKARKSMHDAARACQLEPKQIALYAASGAEGQQPAGDGLLAS